ncbi:MAG: P1 family peptidase [Acidobacteria bacterium]|nr:P1 family peptidase [Acidobacteriota bacterium]
MSRISSITDVEGILVGHYTSGERPTGCTVITSRKPFIAGVDVRGGAPGTREVELLRAENSVDHVDAIFLSGGSAFGLDVGSGISRYLEEQGRGFDTHAARVPIVCGAILYDLTLGDPKIRPGADAGYKAIQAANSGYVSEGNVGAGAGATVGKLFGPELAMKGGLGSWSLSHPNGLRVGALAAVNPVGDIVDPATGRIIAGARRKDGKGFVGSMDQIRKCRPPGSPFHGHTVLAVVATNASLTKVQCTKVAQMAHDALARCIYPAHMPWDGDTIFAISTGTWARKKAPDTGIIGALAADALATAIIRSVRKCKSWGCYPAARDYPGYAARLEATTK